MTQQDDSDSPKRKRRGSSVMAWLLMGMLVAGLGGYGVTNFGGNLRSIGKVGDRDIPLNRYVRGLQGEMQAFGAQVGTQIGMAEALQLGLDARVRQQLVTQTALDNANDRIGLSMGDTRLAAELTSMPSFKGADGNFDRETYRFTLQQNNLTEAEFESGLRDDMARALLQGAIGSGFAAPAPMTDKLLAYVAERRGFSLLKLTEADLSTPLPAPDETALKAHYDANIAAFTRPEAKRIAWAALLPEALAATLPVDEAELRKLYDSRLAEYVKPERRLVERLVFGSDEEAAAAKARLDAGESFETLVSERGLQLIDIDLGDQSQEELGTAGAAVFALAEPGVVGPLPSDLGPALFRMNAILAAEETSFDEAKADLTTEYQLDAARRAIGDRLEAIDDALAGGATLEELAREQAMELGRIDFSGASDDKIAGYPAFVEAANKIAEGDFPEAIALDDGGVVALRLDEIVPAAPIPFDEAREAVTESWQREALRKALAARAAEVQTAIANGTAIGAHGIVSVTPEIARDGFVEGAPAGLMPLVFGMAEGATEVIDQPDWVGLVQLDRILPVDMASPDAVALKAAITAQVEQAFAQDAFTLFGAGEAAQAGIQLDQTAIDAVHAQMR
ncbi:peptidylprolyl isomerase [Gemmobacter denitrificans]|uniref:Peptidyl-prolyl cis-trans isomerase n=1 Tax=Gemmobacter denitrificans TaxID=3123040 RepID=A0ABU8BT77_9RHOB